MKTFRLIRTPAASAAWNMALDEVFMRGVLQGAEPVFRLYQWIAPSFTFGVSQSINEEVDIVSCRKDDISVVRRPTGGGVLFHDNEITYSIACRKIDIGENPGELVNYRRICSFLIRFYESLGLSPEFAFTRTDFAKKIIPSGICCAAHEKYDITINGKKIGGSAQKRSKAVILQHGVVPISIDWTYQKKYLKHFSQDLPQMVTTLEEELGLTPAKDEIENALIGAFTKAFEVCFVGSPLSEKETALVDKLTIEKYGDISWNESREYNPEACLAA